MIKPLSGIKYIFLILMVGLTIYPIYWMFYAGTFASSELIDFVFSFKPGSHLRENYALIDASFNVFRVVYNTLFVAVVGTVGSVLVNLLMGFALAKYNFKYKEVYFSLFVVTMFVGGAAVMIPQFEIVMRLNLYNSLYAIILPMMYSTYTSFLARQTFLDFPTEIMQAGRIDGAGEFGIFFRLVVPNSKAVIATIAIITFMNYWNSYLWNMIVTSTVDKYTFQVALASIYPKAAMWTYAPIKMLGAAMSVIPILIMFVVLQKNFVNSMAGAIKG